MKRKAKPVQCETMKTFTLGSKYGVTAQVKVMFLVLLDGSHRSFYDDSIFKVFSKRAAADLEKALEAKITAYYGAESLHQRIILGV